MNGSTNVQVSALAAFLSAILLAFGRVYLPELMAELPDNIGELFTGALIVFAGLVCKKDAGIKSLPGTGDP